MISSKKRRVEVSGSRLEIMADLICLLECLIASNVLEPEMMADLVVDSVKTGLERRNHTEKES